MPVRGRPTANVPTMSALRGLTAAASVRAPRFDNVFSGPRLCNSRKVDIVVTGTEPH
jgi:hypothetical protein